MSAGCASPALAVLFRDRRVAVIDKPAGMPVHPSRGDRAASVEDLFPSLGPARTGPFLAHRLDRDTSGCLVVALRRSALRAAQLCFAGGTAEKVYWALVSGRGPTVVAGVVSLPLARVERAGGWRMAPAGDAPPAITAWRRRGVLGPDGPCWLELRPRTGRTHQIRAHCAALGCPVLGDAVYGQADGNGLMLHARAIALPLPDGPVAAVAPVPFRMQRWLGEVPADAV